MKIRPLLKTHWLASQNPVTVFLAGLKAVVYNPRYNVLQTSFSSSVGTLSEGYNVVSQQVQYSDAVKLKSYFKTTSTQLCHILSSIEFHMTDGQIFNGYQILIEQIDLLPAFLSPLFYITDRSCHWERLEQPTSEQHLKLMSHLDPDCKKAQIIIFEILAWALQRKRQMSDLEVGCLVESAFHNLTDIQFESKRPVVVTVQYEKNFLDAVRFTYWVGKNMETEPGYLSLYPSLNIDEKLQTGLDPELIQNELAALQADHKKHLWNFLGYQLELKPRLITHVITQLEKQYGTENVLIQNHKQIKDDEFKPHLEIREENNQLSMQIFFKMDDLTDYSFQNFPSLIAPLFAAFHGGIEFIFQIDRKYVASAYKKHRANDLILMRHQGVAIYCLLEMLNWKLGKALTSGDRIEYFADGNSLEAENSFQDLISYLKKSVPGVVGKSNQSFDELFSSEVKNYFLDFIEKLHIDMCSDRFFMMHKGSLIEVNGASKSSQLILRFILLYLTEETQGKVLTKAQSALGEKFKTSLVEMLRSDLVLDQDLVPYWIDLGYYHKAVVPLLFDLSDQNVDVKFNGLPFYSKENPFDFIFNVGSDQTEDSGDWFDLHPQIFFDGVQISETELKFNFTPDQSGFIEYGGRIYRIDKKHIPSLKSLQKFWNKIKGQKNTQKKNKFGDQVYRLDKSVALELLMLKSQGVKINVKGEWKRIFDYYENQLGLEKIKLSDEIMASILPHQQIGSQWIYDLYKLKLGAILADEMGLGKTFQVLSFLSHLHSNNELGHSLIIVPTSLVYNWIEEKNKFTHDLPICVFQTQDLPKIQEQLNTHKNQIVIATYGLLTEQIAFFESKKWNIVIFDEAQNLKNITSLRSVAARKIQAQFKACLTGTPMENNYLEYYSLCDLVVPGCLGEVDAFRRVYYNNEVRTESIRELKLITKPILLRRTKSQIQLNLPEKTIQKVVLPFGEKQKEIYRNTAMTFSRQVENLIQEQGENRAQLAMFSALMRLRQICSDPAAVPGVIFTEMPVKIDHFLKSLEDHLLGSESVIVFTQFLTTLNRIESELKKNKTPHYVLQGKMTSKDRVKTIAEFQNSAEPAVMLMTLKTGGVGLNLTKASVVYHLEPWWNPAVENQATDRAHRMGQKKDVKVYNLLIEGSLEEKIANLKIKKQTAFDRLFDADEESVEAVSRESNYSLSKDDFIYLLKSE